MKTGKLVEIHQQKELTSGKFEGAIIYEGMVDNGDQGEIFVPKGQTPPAKDSDITYEVQETDFGNKLKIQKPGGFKGGFGGRKENPETNKSIQKQKALDVAERSVSNFKFESTKDYATNVLMVAARYYDWLSGKTEKEGKEVASSVKTGIPGVTFTGKPHASGGIPMEAEGGDPEWVNS